MNSTEDSVKSRCNSYGQFPPAKFVQAFLPLLALALASCVITYRDFPAVNLKDNQVQGKEIPIYYSFNPDSDSALAYRLGRAFAQNGIFTQAIETSTPPEKGIYCTVEVKYKMEGTMGFSLFSLVLPMYDQKRYDVQWV